MEEIDVLKINGDDDDDDVHEHEQLTPSLSVADTVAIADPNGKLAGTDCAIDFCEKTGA